MRQHRHAKMNKMIIIDPALRGEAGHHLSLSIELSKAAKGAGHEPVWFGHKDLDCDLVPSFVRFVPAFSSGIYERQIGIFGRAIRPLIGNRRYLRSTFAEREWEVKLRHRFPIAVLNGDRCAELFRSLRSEAPIKDDHLVVHSADSQTIDMLSTWASTQTRYALPEIHVRTCWSTSNMPFADYAGGFVQAMQHLSSVARLVTLSAETRAGALELANETGLNVSVCPHLLGMETMQVPPPENDPTELIVGWLGEPRPEKGVDILADIIRAVSSAKPKRRLKFLLQCGGRTSRKARNLYAQLAEFGEAVELLDVAISQQDYLAALKRCNLMLLPYDPRAYPPERGSGAALEALLTGRPIVATAGTFASELITPESGVTGTDVAALAKGVLTIADNYRRYLDGAGQAREEALRRYDRETCYRLLINSEVERAPRIMGPT